MPTTTLALFSSLKIKGELKPRVDNLVFRLHYRYTFTLYMIGAILSTTYDFVGEKIDCMFDTDDSNLEKLVNSYCYITGTYTVDDLHQPQPDVDVPHPGVGPHKEGDAITTHAYYQWVSIVLVAQGALFYMPHYLWKLWEGGMFRSLIQKLSLRDYMQGDDNIGNYFDRERQFLALSKYIRDYMHRHRSWASKFIFCEMLNVVVSVFTLCFTNLFLGGEFFTYGTEVFALSGMDPENRTDPMSEVFPKMGKCNFKLYGPSGTVTNKDVMCLLPTNVANEKIFIILWVWLMFLITAGAAWSIFRLVSLIKPIRERIFIYRVYNVPRLYRKGVSYDGESKLATKDQARIVLRPTDFSDCLLLSQIADNMEASMFSEFVAHLASAMTGSETNKSSSLTDSGLDEDGPEDLVLKKKEEALLSSPYPSLNA